MPFEIDRDFRIPSYQASRVHKPIRTYIDAYQALIRGNGVHLELTPDGGDSKTLVLTPWQYGRRDFLPQVQEVIERFRDENRPYRNVQWKTIRLPNKSQVQLQFKRGEFPVGMTGLLLDFPTDDLHIRLNFHGGRYIRLEWVALWQDWQLVNVSDRELCLSDVDLDMGKLATILGRAQLGDMIACAAWDWLAFHQNSRPWWMTDLNDFLSSPDYKSWERKLFESKLKEIF